VDSEQAAYVGRRDFVKFMLLPSGAFFVGQVWIGLHSLRSGDDGPPLRRVATLTDIPVGGALVFHYPSPLDPCLLVRPDEDTLLAYSQACTHLSCPVQPDVAAGRLNCPCHNGVFDLKTGRPVSGPPRRPLPRINLEVRDGVISATGVEPRT